MNHDWFIYLMNEVYSIYLVVTLLKRPSSTMGTCFPQWFCLVFFIICSVSEGSDVFDTLINGDTTRTEVAIVIDHNARNLDKIKEFWRRYNISHNGRASYGTVDGSGYETLKNIHDVKIRIEDLESEADSDGSSSELFRYLLKTMSLMSSDGDLVLFTGRRTEEEPLQKACMDKAHEKRCRVLVIWTEDTTEGAEPLRTIANFSNGAFDIMNNVIKQVSMKRKNEKLTAEVIPLSNSKKVTDGEEKFRPESDISVENVDKTLKTLGRVRFPENDKQLKSEPPANATSLGKQQTRFNQFIPIRVEVASTSSLEFTPGGQHTIMFEVKNNLHLPVPIQFQARPGQNIKIVNLQPIRQVLEPLETIKVEVGFLVSPEVPEGGEGELMFIAQMANGGLTPRNAILHFTSKKTYDSSNPRISYKYRGDCRGHDKPDTCETGEWGFEATFQDETSGLKKVLSEPYGLNFNTPFVAGTKSPVTVYYTASCCQPKIEIWAEDGQGNFIRRPLDAYNQGLLSSEIATVVLGVLLLLCIIIGIIVAAVIVRRRKQNKLIIPRYQGNS